MRCSNLFLGLSLLCSSLYAELNIDLKNPTFINGILYTEEGGVITGPDLRIQARKIAYTDKIADDVHTQTIVAEGDLLMDYGDRVFVGSRLEYDFINHTGTLFDGKTFTDIWFVGGDQIEMKPDGSFYIYNAFITTSESQDNTWEINAKKVKITNDNFLAANNIRFQFLKVPLLWLPAFKTSLKSFSDPPIKYKVVWDKGIGPRLTMRYRLFSWRDFNLFFRLDYRLKRGLGAALETEYFTPDDKTTFVTRSYVAKDKSFPYEKGPHRYRFQGLYHTETDDARSFIHLTYDKLSDNRMVGDFKSDDFEINTQRRTRLLAEHHPDIGFVRLSVQPRLNRFQTIEQELPLLTIGIRPFSIGKSGIISENTVSAGYLDYVYAQDVRDDFHKFGLRSSTHSARIETANSLYRPFWIGPMTFTPQIGILGIFYSSSPDHEAIGQGMLSYGADLRTQLTGIYPQLRHQIESYLHFEGLTKPTAGVREHYYFSIDDGITQLNQLRIGVRNTLFSTPLTSLVPDLSADLYTYAFFGERAFANALPKAYCDLEWNRPSYLLRGGIAWNFEQSLWDYVNGVAEWTINENVALGIEFRHRSKYDWRKAWHHNFFVDIARSIPSLLDSPLSDGRDTLLTRFFFRLAPKITCQVQTRHGWGRKSEPRYNAGRIDLYTMLTCSWRLRLSYERIPGDNRFSSSISLVQ